MYFYIDGYIYIYLYIKYINMRLLEYNVIFICKNVLLERRMFICLYI